MAAKYVECIVSSREGEMDKVACPFCIHSSVVSFEDTNFMRCDKCGLFINKSFMGKEELKRKTRTQLLGACHNKAKLESRISIANHQLDVLEKHDASGILYDVGAASGFFMKVAAERGWVVRGNEISISAIDWAKEHYSIDIEYGYLEELELPNDYFDAVVLWHTLEHTHNPCDTILTSRRMLKNDGLIYIEVPNKKTGLELNKHYAWQHLFEFTEDCLAKHLETLGLCCVEHISGRVPSSGTPQVNYLYRKEVK